MAREKQDLRWLSAVKSEFIWRVIFPAYQWKLAPNAHRYLRALWRLEFASREEVEQLQWKRLQDIVRYAGLHLPFYRPLFCEQGISSSSIRTPMDFARLPILTDATLQTRLKELIAECRDPKEGLANASGDRAYSDDSVAST